MCRIIDLYIHFPVILRARVTLALAVMTAFMFFTVKCPNPYLNTLVNLPMMFVSLTVAYVQFNRACVELRLPCGDDAARERR